jgi:pyruvate/2-oxoglutarate dehydrogenase complex dihydrolipoamide dehydrogenase (E3) component
VVAGALAEAGLNVAGIEAVVGECPYWTYIPSKMMIRAANLLAKLAESHAWPGTAVLHPGLRGWCVR